MLNLCLLPYTVTCYLVPKQSCVKQGCYLNSEVNVNSGKIQRHHVNIYTYAGNSDVQALVSMPLGAVFHACAGPSASCASSH